MLNFLGVSQFLVENQWIKWVPTIVIVLIMVLGLLFGLWRGFRKSMHKFVIMLICFAMAFGVFMIVKHNDGELVYNMSKGLVDQALGVTSDDGTLLGALRVYITAKVAQSEGGYEQIAVEVYPQIEVLAVMALRLVSFIVAFIFYLIFLLIINIFYSIFHSEKRYKRRLEQLEKPYHKRRLLGGGVGIVRGLIASTICASFFGLVIYSVSATEKLDKADFTDPTMQDIYDVDCFIRELGNTGIYKILNNMKKDEASAPYYLFFADAILSAKTTSYDGKEYKVKLSHELASISGLAQDMVGLLGKHATDIDLNKLQGEDLINYLDKLFAKPEFVDDLNLVIDRYQGTEYINNLTKITVSAVTKNIDSLLGNSGDPNKEQILNFYHKMFDKEAAGDEYIAPEDIVTFNDTKLLVKGVVSSAPKILDLAKFYDSAQQSPAYTADPMALNINLTNLGLDAFTTFYNSISGLSFLNKEDAKRSKLDGVLNRGIEYSFDLIIGDSGLANPFNGQRIEWFDEIDSFQNAFEEISLVTNEFIKEYDTMYQQSLDFTMQKAMINVLSDSYQGKAKIDKYFDNLTNYINEYKSVQVLLDSELFYTIAENKLGTMLNVQDVRIPQNINWIDNKEENKPGELRIFLNSIRAAISNGALEFAMSNPDFSDINNVKEIVRILDSSYRDTTLLNYIFNSDLLYYVSSISLMNLKAQNFEVLVPNSSLVKIEEIDFIKKQEILDLVNAAPVVLNEISDLSVIQNDPFSIIDILKLEYVRNSLIRSNVLAATVAKSINIMVQENPQVSEMLVIPTRLALTGENDQANVNNWLNIDGNQGELDKLLGMLAIEELDLRKLSAQDPNAIINLTKIDEKKFNTLISSDIIHYSFTKILNKLSTPDFTIMIPGDVYDKSYTDANVISRAELYSVLQSASKILMVDPTTSQLGYDLNMAVENKDILLKAMILHSTAVNYFISMAAKPEMQDNLVIPNELQNVDYNNFSNSIWFKGAEISNILDIIPMLGIDLNNLQSINTQELTNKLLILDEEYQPGITNVDKLCQSKVLSRTLTNIIGKNEVIHIPNEAYIDNNPAAADPYIKASEWLNLIHGIKVAFNLRVGDNLSDKLSNFEALIANVFDADYVENRNALLTSYILESTMIENLIETLNTINMVVLPKELGLNQNALWYAKRNSDGSIARNGEGEIMYILDAFYALEIESSIGQPNFTEIVQNKLSVYGLLVIKGDSEEIIARKKLKQSTLMNSQVLTASFINVIYEMASGASSALRIPYELNYGAGLTVAEAKNRLIDTFNSDFSWVKKAGSEGSELENIFTSINSLRLDVRAEAPNDIIFDLNEILNDEGLIISNVLTSKIIHLTISEELVKNKTLMFVEGNTVDTNLEGEHYVNKAEFDSLFHGMQALFRAPDGTINIKNFKVSTLFGPKYQENMDILFSSNILEATVFKLVYESMSSFAVMAKETEFSFVPNQNILTGKEANLNYWLELGKESSTKSKELRKIFDVINILDLGDAIDSQNVNITLDRITAENINKILNSTVIAATMTKVLIDDTKGALNIPNLLVDEFTNVKNKVKNYDATSLRSEVENVYTALSRLGIIFVGNDVNVDVNSLLDKLNTLDKVQNNLAISNIIYLTVSNKFYSVSLEALNYIDEAFNVLPGYTEEVIKDSEIAHLAKGIQALGNNVNLIEITPADLVNSIDEVLLSKVLQVTVSQKMLANFQNAIFRGDRISNEMVTLRKTNTKIHYLEVNEIKGFLNAINVLGSDGTKFNFTFDESNLVSIDAEVIFDIMINSDIARNIISDNLLDSYQKLVVNPIVPAANKTVKLDSVFAKPGYLDRFKVETGITSDYVLVQISEANVNGVDINHNNISRTMMTLKEVIGMAYCLKSTK